MKSQKKTSTKGLEAKKAESNKAVYSKIDKFPIVAIGASAGGLEALEEFFGNMPKNSGMAFVVIQHLDPHHKGMMSELLQRITEMKVTTATDSLKVKPNSVYVIPPNKSMSILNNVLHLFKPIQTNGLRLPINFFFRSLALDRLEQSIGIVLSGMGSDGSLGAKAIKEEGGIILVQQPESAKLDSMSSNTIKTVSVDIVATVSELPKMLLNINTLDIHKRDINELVEKSSSSLGKIIILLRTQTGNDFSQYKKNTLYRRIERRMGIHQIEKIVSYVRFLGENPAEIEIVFGRKLSDVINKNYFDLFIPKQQREKVILDMNNF